MKNRGLTPLQTLALSRVITDTQDKLARTSVAEKPGTYAVRFGVVVDAIVNIGEPIISAADPKVDPWMIITALTRAFGMASVEQGLQALTSMPTADQVAATRLLMQSTLKSIPGLLGPPEMVVSPGRITLQKRDVLAAYTSTGIDPGANMAPEPGEPAASDPAPVDSESDQIISLLSP